MEAYDAKSCNALEKPYYRPIEAALRWCNLTGHENAILQQAGDKIIPDTSDFPQWPCLRANAERVWDAIQNNALPYGREGVTVRAGEQVAKRLVTVRHADLKAWMAQHYPDQKPKFLFDETERSTHNTFNADSFRALQADRDAARVRLEKAEEWAKKTIAEMNALRSECDSLRAKVAAMGVPGDRSERTYQNTIAALLAVIAGELPGTVRHPSFSGDTQMYKAIEAHFKGYEGLSASNLSRKCPEARRSLNGQ